MTERPLRILLSAYSCEPDRGSEPGVGWNWALGLARRGYHVTVATRANNRSVIEKALEKRAERELVEFLYHDVPLAMKLKRGGFGVHLYYGLWQHTLLKKVLAAHRIAPFDVVHHLTFGAWRQPSRLWRLGIPFVFGPVGGGEEAPPKLVSHLPRCARRDERLRYIANRIALLSPELRRSMAAARLVVAKTRETAGWLVKAGANPVVALEIGIDSCAAVTRLHSDGPLRCLFVGRLLGWKGVLLAVRSIDEAHKRGANVVLTIAGAGPLAHAVEIEISRRGLASKVILVGSRPQAEIFDLYKSHDVLLFPSLHDSSGNVVLEAFAHGLPVVCLDTGGPGEMVDNSCGIAVDTAGTAEVVAERLGDALALLHAEPHKRKLLSFGARSRAAEMTWDAAVVATYSKLFKIL